MMASAPVASPVPPQVLLAHHLRQLKLPTFLREYEKLAAEAAREGLDHVRFLLRLAELELIDRERRMVERRIRAARFPAVKSFDTFDFATIPSLNKPLVLELARCEFVVARENIIALSNSGTGKTHACLALGLAACQRGFTVSFTTAVGLVHQLMEARDEKRLLKLQAQLAAVKLLIIDELGYVPLSQTGASSSRSSASATSVDQPSSRRISHSRNGRASSKASVSPAHCSIASPTMSIFWSSAARATG
jgi:DNA replication protein DnaC